jgi:hypothetical protein
MTTTNDSDRNLPRRTFWVVVKLCDWPEQVEDLSERQIALDRARKILDHLTLAQCHGFLEHWFELRNELIRAAKGLPVAHERLDATVSQIISQGEPEYDEAIESPGRIVTRAMGQRYVESFSLAVSIVMHRVTRG